MSKFTDKRGVPDEEVFTCKITKDKKVFISYYGKQVTALALFRQAVREKPNSPLSRPE